MFARRPSLALPLALFLAAGCATVRPQLHASDPRAKGLTDAAEAFYGATTVEALKAAAAGAAQLDPDSFITHELAARLAQLEGRDADAVEHFFAALRDTADDEAALHLHTVMSYDLTFAERELARAHLEVLVAEHPDAEVRAIASHHLASLLNQEGRLEERAKVLAAIPGVLDLAVAGTWDNDQGKGYDFEHGPEVRPELDQEYEGRVGPVRWRPHAPIDPRGRIDLAALMTPARWSVAYAQATVMTEAAGLYALRMMSTDPLKVWVDGKLVFAAPQLERSVYDHLVVPVKLERGPHRVLIKSAHRDATWFLAARLTAMAGAPAGPISNLDQLLDWRASRIPPSSPARREAIRVAWSHLSAGGSYTVKLADAWVRLAPQSICARSGLVDALWYNQERGRTADTLAALDADHGAALTFIRLRQTRFHQQQGLKQKARTRLLELVKLHPEAREAFDQLADVYRSEGWVEDELAVQRELIARFGAGPEDLAELGKGLLRFGKRDEALRTYQAALDRVPAYGDLLRRVADLALDAGELPKAKAALERRLASWPTDFSGFVLLAEVERRLGHPDQAAAALDQATRLSPDSATPFQHRGDLAYERGDVPGALKEWRRALELNPDNEALANRIDFLAPEARGPWMADIPQETDIDAAVKRRETLAQVPGADVAWLLDHEVTLLNSDGSTSNVVTLVAHAWNAQGRDRIMRQALQSGRLRVLHAYSVDDKGLRSEASSERGRSIFFRGMQPGSTLVLQYRVDKPPHGYLARYFTEQWTFQGMGDQHVVGLYVLWAPLGTTLHEQRVGSVERTEEKVGEQLRFSWSAKDVPPLIAEPGMPTVQELAANIRLSTVPDWNAWLSWEQALLEGVFRDSPELDALATRLGDGAENPEEKLKRVHQFVMEEIRYQQDYETFIAGVKPHPAPMVLERKYGDCKDKAVLFIELAKKLGVEAHFALVRTRDAGPANVDVPMQQFNHAIVYVPEQNGVPAGRFFDPTAELLDLDSVRTDDVGTRSLVYDPRGQSHTWRDIPWQPPEANRELTTLTLALDQDGGAKGTLTLEAVGRAASAIRRMTRNTEIFSQATQRLAMMLVPNATAANARAVETRSLRAPAVVAVDLEARSLARPEGETLRLKLPTDFSARMYFPLATRRHPLVLGAPTQDDVDANLTLPEGMVVKRLPASGKVELPCLALERVVKAEGQVVKSHQSFRITCERISAAEYLTYRARADEMTRLLDDELVIGPAPAGPAPKKVPAQKR